MGNSVQQTLDGGYVITGVTMSFGTGADVYLVKTNASGDTLWTRHYGGDSNDYGYSVQQTSDRGYIIVGGTRSFGAGDGDVYLIKTNATRDTLWTRTYGGKNYDEGDWVQQTLDGGYVIAGYTSSFKDTVSGDVYLIKTNTSGDTLWTRTFGGPHDDEGYCVRQTTDGGYIITGYTFSFNDTLQGDAYLIKTDAHGYAGVEEPAGSRPEVAGNLRATPNPFVTSARIPGHEGERFEVYDASGKMVGTYRGNRIGEGLLPAVYFIKPCDEHGGSLRVVKAR